MLIVIITVMLFCLLGPGKYVSRFDAPLQVVHTATNFSRISSHQMLKLPRERCLSFCREENEIQIKKTFQAYGQPVKISQCDVNNVTSRAHVRIVAARSMDRSRK